MPISEMQSNEIKEKIGLLIDQIMPINGDRLSSDSLTNKQMVIEFINTQLQFWCEEKALPPLTLQSLLKNLPTALPVAGKDLGGARCDILIAYLNCHSEPGSSLETLPVEEPMLADMTKREIILRHSFNHLANYSFLDPLMRRRCKRIIQYALSHPGFTLQESITLTIGPGCLEETKQAIDQAFLKIQNENNPLKRLISIDNMFSELQLKIQQMTVKGPVHDKYKSTLELLAFWRNNPEQTIYEVMETCFGKLPDPVEINAVN